MIYDKSKVGQTTQTMKNRYVSKGRTPDRLNITQQCLKYVTNNFVPMLGKYSLEYSYVYSVAN